MKRNAVQWRSVARRRQPCHCEFRTLATPISQSLCYKYPCTSEINRSRLVKKIVKSQPPTPAQKRLIESNWKFSFLLPLSLSLSLGRTLIHGRVTPTVCALAHSYTWVGRDDVGFYGWGINVMGWACLDPQPLVLKSEATSPNLYSTMFLQPSEHSTFNLSSSVWNTVFFFSVLFQQSTRQGRFQDLLSPKFRKTSLLLWFIW